MTKARYWAGGSKINGWFVKKTEPSPFVGHPDETTLVKSFPLSEYGGSEERAARAANQLAEDMNDPRYSSVVVNWREWAATCERNG